MKDINALPFNIGSSSSVGDGTLYPLGFSLDEIVQFYWNTKNLQFDIDMDIVMTGGIPDPLELSGVPPIITDARIGVTEMSEIACSTEIDIVTITPIPDIVYDPVQSPDPGTELHYVAFRSPEVVKFGGLYYPYQLLSAIFPSGFSILTNQIDGSYTEFGTFTLMGKTCPTYYLGGSGEILSGNFDVTVSISSQLSP